MESKIKTIIRDVKPEISDLSVDDSFESLEFDRWDLICMFDMIQDEFLIAMNYDLIYEIKTVKNLIDYVAQEVAGLKPSC